MSVKPNSNIDHSCVSTSVAAKISLSLGSLKSNPLVSNKGCVKPEDKKIFLHSFESLLSEQKERKKSYDYQSPSLFSENTKTKSHNELALPNDKARKIPKKLKNINIKENCNLFASNCISKQLSDPTKLLSGFELSIKDIGQLTSSPFKQSSCDKFNFVTIGDIQ